MAQLDQSLDPTLTQEVLEARERATLDQTWRDPRGFLGWIVTTNHKRIGLRFIITAFCFFLFGGLLAVMMRLQLAKPLNTVLNPDLYNQVFTTHGTVMMFLFAVPIMEGFGIYFVPLMVGTRNVSFPRLLNFSYYVYLFSGLLLFIGFITNTGPDAGWFAYTPLSGPSFSPGHRMDVWSQMVTLMEISSLSGAVEIITTAFKQRAPGMSLNRIPLFVWAQIVTSFMIIFAMPAVMLGSTLLSMDRLRNIHTHFYNVSEGGDHLLWQHLFWFFGHPEVYIIFIPANGFVSTILVTMCRRKIVGYTAVVLSLIATGFIGFGVWVHHMFATPLPEMGQGMFTAASLMIVVPTGVQMFCWIATIWAGKPRFNTPFLFVLGFIVNFVIGGLTGVILASVSLDLQVHDTYFVVAHLHYVLIGGAVFPLFGALHYWFPKWTGRMYSETLGKWTFALFFIGFNLVFFPMHQLGLHGMTRRIYTYLPETGWFTLNLIASIGGGVMGIAVLLFLINMLVSRKTGAKAGDNPWGAAELEWAVSSPPPSYNFQYPPTVRGRYAIWQTPADAPVVTGLNTKVREVLCTTTLDAVPDHRYKMAGDSIFPIMLSVSVATALIWGGIFHPIGAVIGTAMGGIVMIFWFWPGGEPKNVADSKFR